MAKERKYVDWLRIRRPAGLWHSRGRMLRAASLTLLLLVSHGLRASEAPSLASRFAAAFEDGNLASFDALAAAPPVTPGAWPDVTELLDRHLCVALTAERWSELSDGTIRLVATGSAVSRRKGNPVIPIRTIWILTIDRSGGAPRIRTADRAEHLAARTIAAAAPGERARIAASYRELDVELVARHLAELAGDPRSPFVGRADLPELALSMAASEQPTAVEAWIRLAAAMAARLGGRSEEYAPLSAVALDAARASGDPDAIAWALFRSPGPKTLPMVVSMIGQLDDPRYALKAQTVIAAVHFGAREWSALAREAQTLATLSKEYEWSEGDMNASLFFANVFSALGEDEVSAAHHRSAYMKATALRNERVAALALTQMAMAQRGPASERLPMMMRAVELGDRHFIPSQRAIVHSDLATMLAAAGCLDAAAAVLETMIMISGAAGDTRGAAVSWRRLSSIRFDQQRYAEALALTEIAGAVSDNEPANVEPKVWVKLTAAAALRRMDRLDEAETALREAVALADGWLASVPAEPSARAAALDGRIGLSRALADLLVARGRPRDALAVIERTKARELHERTDHAAATASALTTEEAQRQREVLARLDAANRNLLAGGGDAVALRAEVHAARLAHRAFTIALSTGRQSSARPRVDDEPPAPPPSPTVVFSVMPERTLAFVIDGEDVRPVVLDVPSAQLAEAVDAVATALESRSLGYHRATRALYDLLLAPLALPAGDARPLAIIPDGILWRVPFQTLTDAQDRPLAEQRPLFYAPSLKSLAAGTRESGDAAPSLFAIGNPAAGLQSLDDAESEVRGLARIYDAERSRILTGAAATESAFKRDAPRHDVIHIASHGLIENAAPMYSSLALAATAEDDGLLEAREVLDLRLNARLAVLAGCETARGKVQEGEGIIGLSWAFLAAGCPTIVVSQWKAESASTARLLVAFHEGLAAGRTPAAALREAQRSLMRDRRYAHPFYWAPFVVVGAP